MQMCTTFRVTSAGYLRAWCSHSAVAKSARKARARRRVFRVVGDTWVASDAGLGAIVEQDLRALGFDDPVIDHLMIVRSRFAYPVYDPTRERNVARIRDYMRKSHPSLHPIGRNGMHRYDNQDHAMLSAMHSVDRYFGAEVDPWRVNTERGHHETGVQK